MTSPVAQMPQPAVTQPGLLQSAQPSQSSSDLPRDTASSVGVPQTEVDAVLNTRLNFPDTCTARNSCFTDNGSGSRVPSYDLHALVELSAALGE